MFDSKLPAIALVAATTIAAAGCATTETVWVKPGASQQDFYAESGQCKAQGFSTPGMPMMQVALVYVSCMQGKGWYQEERRK